MVAAGKVIKNLQGTYAIIYNSKYYNNDNIFDSSSTTIAATIPSTHTFTSTKP